MLAKFKKWFMLCGLGIIMIAGVWCVGLSYAFSNPKDPHDSDDVESRVVSAVMNKSVLIADIVSVVTVKGQTVKPEAFIVTERDIEAVSYAEDISFEIPGAHEVAIKLTIDGHTYDVVAMLYILDNIRVLDWEAGTDLETLNPEDFFSNLDILDEGVTCDLRFVTDLSLLDYNKTRRYEVIIAFNRNPIKLTLNLIDTTSPYAEPVNLTINAGETLSAKDFVQNVVDLSTVSCRYVDDVEPDKFKAGTRPVAVLLTDAYGNQSTIKASLTVLPNLTPPVITGAHDMEVLLGSAAMYRKDVSAADSFGNPISFTVDSSSVDTDTPGLYTVTYTAEDASGNQSQVTINVKVVEVSEHLLYEKVDAVLSKIIQDDMTDYEKAKAIFTWISNNVGYTSTSPKESVYEGAYRGFQKRQGDCYTFYAMSEVLLTKAGVENMCVTRINGKSNHYWNLVNADGAGWYHFDSSPLIVHGINRFMFTDSEAEAHTARIYKETRTVNYYTYDKDLYPEVMP